MGAMRWADTVKFAAIGTVVAAVEGIQIFLQIVIAQIKGDIGCGAMLDFQFAHSFIAFGESVDNIGVVGESFHHCRHYRHFNTVAAAGFFAAKQCQG